MRSRLRRLRQRLSATSAQVASVEPSGPRLDGFVSHDAAARLQLTAGDRALTLSHLVLVGRRDGYERRIPLAVGDSGWSVQIGDDLMDRFGTDTVNVFVTESDADAPAVRRRVASHDTDLAAQPGARWRWYATSEGNLSVRRATAVEIIREAGVFDADHYRAQVPDLPSTLDPIEHYVSTGAADGLDPSTMFDTRYYRSMNPSIRRRNPLAHYCEQGWKELFDPSPHFSTWWYWFTHMDPAEDRSSPLAHFEATGKHLGLSTRPDPWPSRSLGPGHRLDGSEQVRRICLFAGWDPDGRVDDYVVAYVRELSRFCDVYYLADCPLPEAELARLAPFTQGAWAIRHGEYDFGSYARLAELVGWAAIESYDELLLVNDSCYLLRPLEEVFARMRAKDCDWWGLQATKGIRETRRASVNQFRDPIPMERVWGALVDAFEQDYTYDFLLGSYFLAFRQPVIRDPAFRRYLGSVAALEKKRHIVKTYEVGLTHWLIQHGHSFDTFIPRLYPFHPIFTRWYLRLLDDGFPLLKRYFLAENHYRVPRLAEWPELVRQRIPDADVEMFERNLIRVSDPEKLRQALHLGDPAPALDDDVPAAMLGAPEFAEADLLSPKHADWWAFPVTSRLGFVGNLRAVFEQVKDDPTVHKIVLLRDPAQVPQGTEVEVVPLDSPLGQHRLMRAGTILIDREADWSATHPVSGDLHNLILLPDEVPIRRSGYAAPGSPQQLERVAEEQSRYRAIVGPSGPGVLASVAAGYPLTFHQVWPTGLPRHDFLTRHEDQLPDDLREELTAVRDLVGDRNLVLFLPAADGPGLPLAGPDLERLRSWLEETGSLLGVLQPAVARQLPALDLSELGLRHQEMLLRASSILVTDDAGPFVDYALTGRPLIGFVPDPESRRFTNPLLWDLDLVFAGPICRTAGELGAALADALDGVTDPSEEIRRRLFFASVDDQNSFRVVEKVRDLVAVHGIGTWSGERFS